VTLRTEAVRELSAWAAPTPDQVAMRGAYLKYLAENDDAMWRRCEPGHLTASALVLDHERQQVLLTLHPKVGRWLQTGGHCEPGDRTLASAALREATEESGIAGLELLDSPARLDRHRVHCHGSESPDSEHLDVQYVAVAPSGAEAAISEESLDLRWWPVDALPNDVDGSVRALVSRAVALAGGPSNPG
jgi:8-oxo-dGTP pyrophosphatase MutT (NUDIX family)